MLNYITEEKFFKHVSDNPAGHWEKPTERWHYHKKARDLVAGLNLLESSMVLELGTMGINIVENSDTLDIDPKNWPLKYPVTPTYEHDARKTPWPVPSDKYEVLIALRVFQHLYPSQQAAFLECRRVAKRIVILVPEEYPHQIFKGLQAQGVTEQMFQNWNDGLSPTYVERLPGWLGTLFYWNFASD